MLPRLTQRSHESLQTHYYKVSPYTKVHHFSVTELCRSIPLFNEPPYMRTECMLVGEALPEVFLGGLLDWRQIYDLLSFDFSNASKYKNNVNNKNNKPVMIATKYILSFSKLSAAINTPKEISPPNIAYHFVL